MSKFIEIIENEDQYGRPKISHFIKLNNINVIEIMYLNNDEYVLNYYFNKNKIITTKKYFIHYDGEYKFHKNFILLNEKYSNIGYKNIIHINLNNIVHIKKINKRYDYGKQEINKISVTFKSGYKKKFYYDSDEIKEKYYKNLMESLHKYQLEKESNEMNKILDIVEK